MPAKEAPFIRFQKGYKIDPETGCWNWTGQFMTSGYGLIKCFGQMKGAHRLSHELYHGPIPENFCILHSCDNKKCVNPDHIRSGTHAENTHEAIERGLIKTGENHPLYGDTSRRGAVLKTARPVMVMGKAYGSLNEAERQLGLGSGTVAFWIRQGKGKATAMSREDYFKMENNNG